MNMNIQDHNAELSEMYLLFKNHKKYDPEKKLPLPSPLVVSGNKSYNVHLSELLS